MKESKTSSSSSREEQQQQQQIFGPNDVMLGRSSTAFLNPGNKRFRQSVVTNAFVYNNQLATRDERTCFVQRFIDQVHLSGGRFLRYNRGGIWERAPIRGVREKVAHALRDAFVVAHKTKERKMLQRELAERKKEAALGLSRSLAPPHMSLLEEYQSNCKTLGALGISSSSSSLPSTNNNVLGGGHNLIPLPSFIGTTHHGAPTSLPLLPNACGGGRVLPGVLGISTPHYQCTNAELLGLQQQQQHQCPLPNHVIPTTTALPAAARPVMSLPNQPQQQPGIQLLQESMQELHQVEQLYHNIRNRIETTASMLQNLQQQQLQLKRQQLQLESCQEQTELVVAQQHQQQHPTVCTPRTSNSNKNNTSSNYHDINKERPWEQLPFISIKICKEEEETGPVLVHSSSSREACPHARKVSSYYCDEDAGYVVMDENGRPLVQQTVMTQTRSSEAYY